MYILKDEKGNTAEFNCAPTAIMFLETLNNLHDAHAYVITGEDGETIKIINLEG